MLDKTNLYAAYTEGGKRQDVESLCKSFWDEICSLRNKWVMHKCKGMCRRICDGIDGNEKRRPMCAAPRSKIRIRSDLPTIVQCGQVENAEVRKPKYGNGNTKVRRKVACRWQRVSVSKRCESQVLIHRTPAR